MNLLKGVFGTSRNPAAHVPRISWRISEQVAHEVRGTFTLKLWDENGGRPVTLGGVTYP
ncbi:hypothetical protein ATI61_1135 [Archangium gephyra]|uniref:Uncharacterized protein n=1 Tax=Archangium gephyra TaxID=48 RepID=A0ABX9JQY4_9BACT|nr:hypothetical protein [Archangium gephyra]REG24943.1 hypothetical protein ATI61_1135 [Archangium gephyra]